MNLRHHPRILPLAMISAGAILGCHEAQAPTVVPTSAPTLGATSMTAGVAGAPSTPDQLKPPIAINAGQCPEEPLLDDLEDADSAIVPLENRSGSWSTYADQLGSTIAPSANDGFKPEGPGADSSKYAIRIQGKTAAGGNAYAGVGFWFTKDQKPYDASCCKGVSFRAKRAKGSIDTVRLKVGDTNTLPEGHVCKNCYNDFGIDLGFLPEWKLYRIPFEAMRQSPNWGDPFPKITASSLLQLQWQVSHPGFDFDIWIDDVRLFDCGTP